MATRVPVLLMLHALLLVLTLSGCMKNASGQASSTAETTVADLSSKSAFIRRQLVQNSQAGKGLLAGPCLNNCVGNSLFPNCCSVSSLGVCVNLLKDPLHCGSCTTVCPVGTICCLGKCVNTSTDINNCGVCGKSCPAPGVCSFGLCNYHK